MIQWFPETSTLVLDLHNLEHCGFDLDLLDDELFLNGIKDEKAKQPHIIVVELKIFASPKLEEVPSIPKL